MANEQEVLNVQENANTPKVTTEPEVPDVHEVASCTEPPPSFQEFVLFAGLQQLRAARRGHASRDDGHIVLEAVRCNPCMA